MRKLAPKASNIAVEFVKADLDSKGMKNAVTAIQETAENNGIDYLVMTQNGTPAGRDVKWNADGHDTAFAVQAISRFALAYLLTTRGGLAENAIAPLEAGQSATTLFMNQSKRDSVVLDSVTEELSIRYRQYRYYSQTEEFNLNIFPGYIKYLMWLGLKLIGTTPDQYAAFPVYILAAPDAQKALGSGKYFDRVLKPTELGAWAKIPKNREALWGKLMEIIGSQAPLGGSRIPLLKSVLSSSVVLACHAFVHPKRRYNSPLLTCTGPWKVDGADGDSEADKYNLGTFAICADPSCSVTLAFTGTEVHVVGAYRLNSCPYSIKLDGQTLGTFGPDTVSVEQFQIDLINKTNLAAGAHTLTISPNLINQSTPVLNLDYVSIVWKFLPRSSSSSFNLHDTKVFVYAPSSAWTAIDDENFPGLPDFDEGTGQQRNRRKRCYGGVFFRTLYGAIGAQGGPYSVQIGDTLSTFTARQNISDPNPLWRITYRVNYCSMQAEKSHSHCYGHRVVRARRRFNRLYATLNSVPGPISQASPSSTPSASPSTSQVSSHGLSPGQVGGMSVVNALRALSAGFSGVLLLKMRGRHRDKSQPPSIPLTSTSTWTPNIYPSNAQHLSTNAAGAESSAYKGTSEKRSSEAQVVLADQATAKLLVDQAVMEKDPQ
ncbi:hypothetical protein C8R45DRAFT_1112690 [Mycena sanguinolenta]|nr:hypothetical protein C8R45DRAFT_1112690 [Mycena sanguinolenta]